MSRRASIFSDMTLPVKDDIAPLQRVAALHSRMPRRLPVAVPSHTAVITPTVRSIKLHVSCFDSCVCSMNTDKIAVLIGMADLHDGVTLSATHDGVLYLLKQTKWRNRCWHT